MGLVEYVKMGKDVWMNGVKKGFTGGAAWMNFMLFLIISHNNCVFAQLGFSVAESIPKVKIIHHLADGLWRK